jgi:predicted enzyme related to lactoylglutathione lyase
MRNPVVHFEVLGRDPSALRKFYSEAFGWEMGPPDDGPLQCSMVHLKGGSGGIDGGIGKSPQGPPDFFPPGSLEREGVQAAA